MVFGVMLTNDFRLCKNNQKLKKKPRKTMKLDSIRREYRFAALTKQSVAASPIDQFKEWLNDAQRANVNDFSAMSLVTAETGAFPQSRIVLLKDI